MRTDGACELTALNKAAGKTAYDEICDEVHAREKRVLEGISCGHEEALRGKTVGLDDALRQLDGKWGF